MVRFFFHVDGPWQTFLDDEGDLFPSITEAMKHAEKRRDHYQDRVISVTDESNRELARVPMDSAT